MTGALVSMQDAQRIVVEELTQLRERIVANMISQGAVASGRTIASLVVQPTEGGAELVSQQKMPFGVLETGRRAGKIPLGLNAIIRQWMQDKGLRGTPIPYKTTRPHKYTPQERGDIAMAGAIAHTIATKGTRLFRNGGRDTIYSNEIPVTIERINERVVGLLSASVDAMIDLNTKE